MKNPGGADRLHRARADFGHSLGNVREGLRRELGVDWKSVGVGVLLVAGAIGFSLARSLTARRKCAGVKDAGA